MVEQDKLFLLDASPDPEGQDVAGSFDLSGLIERINYAIRKYKARRVAIDSITAVFQQYDAVSVVRQSSTTLRTGYYSAWHPLFVVRRKPLFHSS